MISLAVWIQYASVTDRQTGTGRQLITRLRIASGGKQQSKQQLPRKITQRSSTVIVDRQTPCVMGKAVQTMRRYRIRTG